jgi:hypothetical protein
MHGCFGPSRPSVLEAQQSRRHAELAVSANRLAADGSTHKAGQFLPLIARNVPNHMHRQSVIAAVDRTATLGMAPVFVLLENMFVT